MNLDEDRDPELASMAHWVSSAIATGVIAIIVVAALALLADAPPEGSPPRQHDPPIYRLERLSPHSLSRAVGDTKSPVEPTRMPIQSMRVPPSAVLY